KVLPSNLVGKWAVGIISIALFLAMLEVDPILQNVLMAATLIILAISLALYVRRFVDVLRAEAG
ncbi:MAG: hypothetical protein WBG01_13930, partial [Bacteroidota bacterium]